MDPNSVAPMTKMQILAMVKLRSLKRRRSSSGFLMCSAWTTKPAIRATPRTKLMTTEVLVKLPVVPTSDNEYTKAARPGESRQKPRVSKADRNLSSVSHLGSQRAERTSVRMPIGTFT